MEYFKIKEITVPEIEAFASFEEATSRPLEGAVYDVHCHYKDADGNVFKESFSFHIDYEIKKDEYVASDYIHFHIHLGHEICAGVHNPARPGADIDVQVQEEPTIDTSYVLVLGPDSSPYISKLQRIREAIGNLGYNSILIRDQRDLCHESVEQKVLRHALLTRFSLVEDSIAAGQIDELGLLARSRVVVAVLRQQGKGGTWMQSDYDIDFPVRFFSYDPTNYGDLVRAVARAVDWADGRFRDRQKVLSARYPWR